MAKSVIEGRALNTKLILGFYNLTLFLRKIERIQDLKIDEAIHLTMRSQMKNSSLISFVIPLFTSIRSLSPFEYPLKVS